MRKLVVVAVGLLLMSSGASALSIEEWMMPSGNYALTSMKWIDNKEAYCSALKMQIVTDFDNSFNDTMDFQKRLFYEKRASNKANIHIALFKD